MTGKTIKEKVRANSLFVRIIAVVITGITALAVLLSAMNISLSKEVFVENFAESQRKIFNQIDTEFYELYKDVAEVLNIVSSSPVVQEYITENYADQREERRDILDMKALIEETPFSDYPELNLLMVGVKGNSYIHNSSSVLAASSLTVLEQDISREAVRNPGIMVSGYSENGYTSITAGEPVVVFAKAMENPDSRKLVGIVYILMRESDFQDLYAYFTSNTSEILLFNQEYELLSASDSGYFENEKSEAVARIMKSMEEDGQKHMTIMDSGSVRSYQMQNMQNTDYRLVGILNPDEAFAERYRTELVILLAILVTGAAGFVIFWLIRAQTKPIYELAHTMEKVREGNLEEYAEVKGTEEIRQLTSTYNTMIRDINQYIEQIVSIEKEKRTAEIHALQMQINPHYMYNTLASIKWLAWQQDRKKTTEVIDAFISLLRNTISNTDEFITVEQEIRNLENYVKINQVRYGDHVKVEYYIPAQCMELRLPKLILQPFVENAFFHGFPEGRTGCIQIFARLEERYLRFDIEDNGVGMNAETLMSLKQKEKIKGEHFTGIGVNNVDDRIKMIYGMDYGINIVSKEESGTTVTIKIPIRK